MSEDSRTLFTYGIINQSTITLNLETSRTLNAKMVDLVIEYVN